MNVPGDWGTASDVLAAVGTVGAFAATWLLLQREQKARREEQWRALVAEARKVSFTTTGSGVKGGYWDVDVTMKNEGLDPVYGVQFRIESSVSPVRKVLGSGEARTLRPGASIKRTVRVEWEDTSEWDIDGNFETHDGVRWHLKADGELVVRPSPARPKRRKALRRRDQR